MYIKNNKVNELNTELENINDKNFIETKNFLFEIEKLKNKVNQLQTEISNKNNSIESINSRIEEYKGDFDDQKDTIKKL